MKYIIASDIHGSLSDVKKLAEMFEQEKADKLILLGDLYYNNSEEYNMDEINEIVRILCGFKDSLIAVRGNCDSNADCALGSFEMHERRVIRDFKRNIFLNHGHMYSQHNLPHLIAMRDVFCFGHTHVPLLVRQRNIYILNPGSLSLPKGGSAKGYAVMDKTGFALKTLNGTLLKALPFND